MGAGSGQSGPVSLRAGGRTCQACRLEAASSAPARGCGARQHSGIRGNIRQDRVWKPGAGRSSSSKPTCRRPFHGWTICTSSEISPMPPQRLHRRSADSSSYLEVGPGSARPRIVPPGPRRLSEEAEAGRGRHAGRRPPSRDRAPGVERGSRRVSDGGRSAQRRRSDGRLAKGQGTASRARPTRRNRPRAAGRTPGIPSAPGHRFGARNPSRSSSRRHPSSTAGRSRACGLRVPSRTSRARPTTT